MAPSQVRRSLRLTLRDGVPVHFHFLALYAHRGREETGALGAYDRAGPTLPGDACGQILQHASILGSRVRRDRHILLRDFVAYIGDPEPPP